MKISRKTKTSNEISTSSMPDIIFMLLIFFMVTTVMREYEGLDVIMPRAKMIEKLDSKRHTSYVWATKDGLVSVDDNRYTYTIKKGECFKIKLFCINKNELNICCDQTHL